MPIGAMSTIAGEKALGGFEMQTDPSKGEAIFTRHDPDGIDTTKRYVSPADSP